MNSAITQAVTILKQGGLVALPTETVYGLAADARNAVAVQKVFRAKGRPSDHPLIVHLATASAMDDWARDIPTVARDLAHAFWPGPLTLVLRRRPGVLDAVTGGMDTIALRVPDHPLALAVLTEFAGGLAAPSANRYGKVSPTNAAHVEKELGAVVDFILDGGSCRIGIESTIVDVSDGKSTILRPGFITPDEIEQITGNVLEDRLGGHVRSPGLKASHYAPHARVQIVDAREALGEVLKWHERNVRVGLLASLVPEGCPAEVHLLRLDERLEIQVQQLYSHLREADACGLDVLVAVPPTGSGLAMAVRDRLYRSAGLGDVLDQSV